MAKVIVDLDDTLIEHPGPNFEFGDPKPGAKEFLETLKAMGHEVIIHTARISEGLAGDKAEDVEAYVKKCGFVYDEVWNKKGKPRGDIYIDDRSFPFSGDWSVDGPKVLERIGNTDKEKVEKFEGKISLYRELRSLLKSNGEGVGTSFESRSASKILIDLEMDGKVKKVGKELIADDWKEVDRYVDRYLEAKKKASFSLIGSGPKDDPIVAAAVVYKGRIYTGEWHGIAIDNAILESGYRGGIDDFSMNADFISGFITKSGKFLDRQEAYIYSGLPEADVTYTGLSGPKELLSEDIFKHPALAKKKFS